MKQLFQSLDDGNTFVEDIPLPKIEKNYVLVKNFFSVISPGTENMLVDFGKGNLLSKAMQQPEKVKDVIDKAKTDGIFSAYEAVTSKLGTPIPLGYSSAGEVIESDSEEFKSGDLVITNGCHAEVVKVNKNLCAKVPDGVNMMDASFTVIGSVGMQSIRLLDPKIDEFIIVFGLGIIGFITAQILHANGCRVLGVDPDQKRCAVLADIGIETFCNSNESNLSDLIIDRTNGLGADGVIISAKTNDSNLIGLSANLLRKRGKIILSGTTGLNLNRDDFYEKEITFQVSCSYGPGRYDPNYETKGLDYPPGYVRWTEKRNFESILNLLKNNRLNLDPLKDNVISFDEAINAYHQSSNAKLLTTILKYSYQETFSGKSKNELNNIINSNLSESPVIGFLGSGNYASRILIPAFAKQDCKLHTIVSKNGISQLSTVKKYNIPISSTDERDIFDNSNIDTVVISTRHNQHADQVIKSLQSKKHVFIEKPLAISNEELSKLKDFIRLNQQLISNHHIMIGFNRRYSKLSKITKKLMGVSNTPKFVNITVNAGYIPNEHWTQDREIGGGRLIGEACHFIDFSKFLVQSEVESYNLDNITRDTFSIRLVFKDASISVINYLSTGHKSYPKERIEIFYENKNILIDNFRKIRTWGFKKNIRKTLLFQDKGNISCVEEFIKTISKDSEPLLSIENILETTEISIKLSDEMLS